MGMKICPNCSEKLTALTKKCPKCGIILEKTTSPVLIGIAVGVILLVVVIAGLIFF
jgi:uncharacterized protein (UPF0212 family)